MPLYQEDGLMKMGYRLGKSPSQKDGYQSLDYQYTWSNRNFEKITKFCGGLIEIHKEPLKMSNYFVAKIKAKGNLSGFILACISISGRWGVYALKLKNMSKMELGRMRFLPRNPLSVMDFAFLRICGEDSDVEQGDWVDEKGEREKKSQKSKKPFGTLKIGVMKMGASRIAKQFKKQYVGQKTTIEEGA